MVRFSEVAFLTVFTCAIATAQGLVPSGSAAAQRLEETFRAFSSESPRLKCSFLAVHPRLSFSLHYWTGFDVSIPVSEFQPTSKKNLLAAFIRVTPKDGTPQYLAQRSPLPPIPDGANQRRVNFNFSGGFTIGPGKYTVSVVILTHDDKLCMKTWNISARSTKSPLRIAPGVIGDSMYEWAGLSPQPESKRVTVFVNVTPLLSRSQAIRMSAWDQAMLLGTLTSLLDTSRFSHARVIAYNFDTQQVVFEEDQFNRDGYIRLREKVQAINLGVVSVDTLLRINSGIFFEQMIRKELERTVQPDTVLFLGPVTRQDIKLHPALKEIRSALPHTIGISFFPVPGREDLVTRFISAGKGKLLSLYRPADMNKAIRLLKNED